MFGRKQNSNSLTLSAANAISANVMIADENLNIVYMNDAVKKLMRAAESDLKRDLPKFSVDTLIGTNIDVFHKNPSHQRQMLLALKTVHRATIRIGNWTFDLVATPLKKSDGSRAGTVVEWSDASIRLQNLDFAGQVSAANRSQAVIEFNLDGSVVTANENFLNALGYTLPEIQGKHHSMFVSPVERDSAAYREFWAALNRGEYQAAEYKRIGKGGKEVWIQASYNPVFDEQGQAVQGRQVRHRRHRGRSCATPILPARSRRSGNRRRSSSSSLTARSSPPTIISCTRSATRSARSRASITACSSIRPSATAPAYREFWAALNRGEYQAGEYKRIGKGGKEVWIQASYNPILDLNGKPFKVVKYATDITKQVLVRMGNERVRGMMESVAAGAKN